MSTNLRFTRRQILKSIGLGATAALISTWAYRRYFLPKKYFFKGEIVGANSKVGHLLRKGVNATPTSTQTVDTLIVGGGIAGLSAAWWLKKNNFTKFKLLEMDTAVGGNSNSGENSVSKYPWGAHYVPVPGPDAHYVREFFEDIKVITGYKNNLPIYNDYYLCADMHERLFYQGQWHEGLIPQQGISSEDKKQYDEFFSFVDVLKNKKGSDQKHAFTIPMELSSQDQEFLKFDKLSMADFMKSRGWTSNTLNWYVNYCCRDDYGMPHNKVSAWAGLHYFAARAGLGANTDSQSVLTWPEGNGFLAHQLETLVQEHIQKNSLIFSIEAKNKLNTVKVFDPTTSICTEYLAKNIIYCGARFTAKKVIKNYTDDIHLDYAPWMVANITLSQRPDSQTTSLAWDNVSYYSKSLGYIVANHQDLKMNRKEAVITYYLPLDEGSPLSERISAYQKSHEDWLELLIPDLEKMHPGISQFITNVDVWVWGHGMISPGVNFLWSSKRKELLKSFQNIHFAHSDMSGISIFEEAQFRGVEAAKKVLASLLL
ncbi:MAG: NAD(P)/FAD-dependent oxidoreductase [Bdellovibrionaceae bacterium]|nr:NAD(P)/FAD-dependent oxidoreductase [Pseudobdellovibrionaceae bacterium]